MIKRIVRFLEAFGADRNGAVALFFGLTLVPILASVGMAIDYSHALEARSKLGAAIDAAALAVGSSINLSEEQLQARAQAYFDANFPAEETGISTEITVTSDANKVTISVAGTVETIFLGLFGVDDIEVKNFTEVSKKQKKIELVMVLDNTGSMSWSGKIGALKDASGKLVDILFGENTTSTDVKVGLVPFAAAVNIGSAAQANGWIDTNAQSSIAAEDFQPGTNNLTLYGNISNRSWNGCVRARPVPYDTSDTAPSGSIVDTLWVPYFAPDEPDFSGYANRYASDDGYSGSYWNYDARQRYTEKYSGLWLPGSEDDGPDFNCRTPALTPMTNVKGTAVAAINAMVATGSTVIPAGLAWGWRLISPSEPFTEGVAYDDEDTIKAIVLLTDGRNSVGGGLSNHNNSYYNAYGFATSGHLGTTSGWQAESVLDNKTSTLCTNIKSNDVRLYTITFQLSDGPIKDLMRACATKEGMYYDSPSNEQLDTIFEEIAKGLSDLRISQ